MQNAEILKSTPYSKGYPISISGPSAVGKTTIGTLLSEKLGYKFFDLDEEICKEAGMKTTKEVIGQLGHEEFKKIQTSCLEKIVKNNSKNYIVSAGGEIIRPGYNEKIITKNRGLIKNYTYNIALMPSDDADEIVEVLYPRLNDGKRDTRTKGPEEFKVYVEVAIDQYIKLADLVVLTHQSSVENTLSTIFDKIQ